ncbi:ribokinase [Shewanella sp. OPT22]|nr:ribokinase [Shewanella sp. OPT22]
MANILLIANLNCDRVLHLDKPIHLGGRFLYEDSGRRIGGGGSNTGISLVMASHKVGLITEVGSDNTGHWLVQAAHEHGMQTDLIQHRAGDTQELLLLVTPDGERTIIRPNRPLFELGIPPKFSETDAVYVNSSAQGINSWCKIALNQCLVVAQLGKDERKRPCHVLIASATDMLGRTHGEFWEYGYSIAGSSLKYFIVTNGEHGATVYTSDMRESVRAVKTEVIDATGAGDAYAAGLIHGLVNERSIIEAMQEAANWAACAVATDSSIPGEKLERYLSDVYP